VSEESLFREVDEEVRREQLAKIWQRYGNVFVGLSLGIVIAVAGIKGWQYWERTQAEAAGSAYFAAVALDEAKKSSQALAAFAALAKSGHGGYAVLARFRVAAALAGDGDSAAALKAYDELAGDARIDQSLRDLARVRAAYIVADSASAADLARRLAGLDAADNPWRNAVNEIIAVAAYQAGDYVEADRRMSAVLADPALTAGARQRAQIFLQVLQPLIVKPSETQ
jgi:hypothetical protein